MNLIRGIIFSGLMFLSFISPPDIGAQENIFKIHVLNAGYGDAILLRFPDETAVLVDAGTKKSSLSLSVYLRSINLQHIHAAIITHPHQNHFEGFTEILQNFSVGRLFINGDSRAEEGYQELLEAFRARKIPIRKLSRLDQLFEGKIKVLHPAELTGSVNGNSIVLMVSYKRNSFLLLADAGPEQLNEIVRTFPEVKNADVIQIPHHGKSVDQAFINNFQDKIFIISTGPSQWGMPDEELLKKLKGRIFRTDQQGTIVLESDGKNIKAIHE